MRETSLENDTKSSILKMWYEMKYYHFYRDKNSRFLNPAPEPFRNIFLKFFLKSRFHTKFTVNNDLTIYIF